MAVKTYSDRRDRPLGELFRELSDEVTTLVRQETELAKAEVREKAKETAKGAALLVGAATVGLLGLGALTAFLILALDGAIPNWAAALVVGATLAVVAAVLASIGRNRLQEAPPPVPREAIESTKEDIEWAKTQLKSGRR
jgi:uncharacterized membrane protein YqjE